MNVRAAGFTLIELLVVIAIIGGLAAFLLPDLLQGQETANREGDAANMRQHHTWLLMAKTPAKLKGMPTEGGHKFLLTLWTKEVIDQSVQNFDRFFTPGIREQDPHWQETRKLVERNEKIWTSLALTTPEDTHYAARAKEHIRGMDSPKEAWIANDNEGGWAFRSGVINILWGDGSVRPLTLQDMIESYGLVDKENEVFKSFGKDSPHPALQKLEN